MLNFRSAQTIAQSFLPLFYSIIFINLALNISHECRMSTKIISNQIASILIFLSEKTTTKKSPTVLPVPNIKSCLNTYSIKIALSERKKIRK